MVAHQLLDMIHVDAKLRVPLNQLPRRHDGAGDDRRQEDDDRGTQHRADEGASRSLLCRRRRRARRWLANGGAQHLAW